MATAVRKELDCSICLEIYKDPVMLSCGHNFCRVCIDCVLDKEEGSGGYSCPQCRKRSKSRPTLNRNITLCNIVETFRFTHSSQKETGIFCTYCIHSPVPAVKSCLMCEASLCNDHLSVHSKSPEHVLMDPTTSMENRKCSIHKKILEYYCTEDSACICVSCRLDGEHRGHKVETLDEASEKKKQKLRNVLQKLMTEREETEKRVQSLQDRRRKVQEKSAGERERVTALFIELRRHLEDLEKRILREISSQEEQISHSLSDLIAQLEIKKEDLSRKMEDIEELCNMTDPLTILQESDTGDRMILREIMRTERDMIDSSMMEGNLDVSGISHTLHTGLSNMIQEVNVFFYKQVASDILLDVNTAHNNLQISGDMKTVSWSIIKQKRRETSERFQHCAQVLGSQRFSSGRHYWEVDVSKSENCRVGMCYPSIDRRGGVDQSGIGYNNKSWGLWRQSKRNKHSSVYSNVCCLYHDNKQIMISPNLSSNRVRIYVDYEAGQLSFYELCDPIRHLHTFTTTFTEPLHAGLCVWEGCIKISGRGSEEKDRIKASLNKFFFS